MQYLRANRGGATAWLIGVLFLLFIVIIIVMYSIIPHERVKDPEKEEEKAVERLVKVPNHMEQLLQDLQNKEDIIKKKEKQLEEQEKRIIMLKQELAEVKKDVFSYQDLITSTVTQVLQAEKKNIKKLSNVLGLMSPEEAVMIIRKLDDTTAVSILSDMKPRASAKILGVYATLGDIHAERVARISELMKRLTILPTGSAGP